MNTSVKVVCENTNTTLSVEWGSTLGALAQSVRTPESLPFLAAYVNNSIRELDYRIAEPVTVKFIDISHFEGVRVYQRTLFLTLHKAVHDLYPDHRFRITQSVSRGFYCEIEGVEITPEVIGAIKARMDALIAAKLPIVRHKLLREEVIDIYRNLGFEDKVAILTSRPNLYVTVYTLDDMAGYFYGALAPNTSYLHLYDLKPYYNGIYIAVPCRTAPDTLEPQVAQDKMFDVFQEYKHWVDVMGVSTVGQLNRKIVGGDGSDLVKIAEAFHEKKLAGVADRVAEEHTSRGAKVILVSGPSSSGKTTFSKRLGIQLRILGLEPVMISLDDYFLDRENTPRDENGDYDFETIDALDIATFNDHLMRLLAGESVDIPRYDFITGRRQWHDNRLTLGPRSVLVVEGIHALNPRLTAEVPDHYKFKIYLSCFTSISMDDLSRIATTDNRLIRRIVRDNAYRGADATSTLKRWQSVRRGEEKHIFPYQENADVMFNSSLFYELPVLKRHIVPLLYNVPDTVEEYGEAQRLLKFLDNFCEFDEKEIPPTSLLREFIGGSSFTY
ncbi:MAG: nucleoside kinase [Tidjanibacter sp.]|nr:nucleoside kinase [Tidjanibacter sp.]MBR1957602.1 nucleoside kinase [Tidjanibacter sp.]